MRHELSPIPWQADYLYASKLLADRLTKVELRDDEDVARFSDHLPLIAEFDL
jgi:exonuclease III